MRLASQYFEHLCEIDAGPLRLVDRGELIERADFVLDRRWSFGFDQIDLIEQDYVSKGDLLLALMLFINRVQKVLGVEHRNVIIERQSFAQVIVNEEGLYDRTWISQSGGFYQNAIELVGAFQ